MDAWARSHKDSMEFYEMNNPQLGSINQVHKLLKLYYLDIAIESQGIFAI